MDPTPVAVALLVIGVLLCAIELVAPGLVILPFGVGAIVASLTGFLGASPVVQAVIFLVVSLVSFIALRPIARRLNAGDNQDGIGARRLIGAHGLVLEHIAPGDTGLVRVDREEWRAEAVHGDGLVVGTAIRVVDVRGTRVVVEAATREDLT